MTSKERVFAALNHQQPDRVPADAMLEASTLKTLMDYFHTDDPQVVYDALQVDVQFVYPDSTLPPPQVLEDGSWINYDGIRQRKIKNAFCEYSHCIYRPLQDAENVADLEKYDRWPDANNYDWEHYSEKIGTLHEKYVIKLPTGGLFENAWRLRGQEQFLIDMYEDPEIPHYIMEKQCNFWCDYVRRAMEVAGDKVDIIYTYDDIATQASLIMSPQMLEEFVYPYHRRYNAVIKSFGKKILYHSCGSVISQIDQLRQLPIDILNPLQPQAAGMDFQYIKDTWGDGLCFHGGIDIQGVLPNGTPDEVRAEVKRVVNILGKNGGYVLCASHNIQNDTPVENILAMYDVAIR